MTGPTRPEVVQALTSALLGMGTAALDDVPAATAAERAAAGALVAAVLGAEGDAADRRAQEPGQSAEHGPADADVSPDAVARELAEAWRVRQQIMLAVDELDD